MATYNGSNYIKKQVISILEQLSSVDELVISDDNSTDDTLAIIQSFNDERIKIFRNISRIAGPISNFENALKNANGNYIFLADQDDIWLSNKIETHINAHKNHDLVISDCYVVNEAGKVLHDSFFQERNSGPGFFKNLKKNSYIGCCMSFNRKLLMLALPFPSYIHMHDWWIGLIAELRCSTFFCEDRLIYYVRHNNNASPTLGKSGYSGLKRLSNRVQLIVGLLFVIFKR